MTTRIAVIAAVLLSAGAARAASTSAVPSSEEKILETGAPATAPYLDYTSCTVDSKALTAALIQVPDQDRGSVQAAGNCQVASSEVAPAQVDDRYRR